MPIPACVLKFGREKSLLARHPWVFSGALQREPNVERGETVDVVTADGHFVARGAYNPDSQIRVRVYTFEPETIDESFFERRIREALAWRRALLPADTNAFRVCFAEGDELPGVIVDHYDGFVALQLQTAGADARRDDIVEAIRRVLAPKGIYERSDSGFRREEGLDTRTGPLFGDVPPATLPVKESGVTHLVDIANGQKTGMFLDQRDSRAMARRLATGKSVLNVFSYTGGFALAALAGGATRAVNIDTSGPALAIAREAYRANGFAVSDADFIEDDAFARLRVMDERFDVVILDPPAFCKSQSHVKTALRGYKDVIMQGLRRTNVGGLLLAFSCSGHVDADLFQKVIFGAALDVGRQAQILARLGHSFDHPINIYHPEGEYLSGYVVRAGREEAHAR